MAPNRTKFDQLRDALEHLYRLSIVDVRAARRLPDGYEFDARNMIPPSRHTGSEDKATRELAEALRNTMGSIRRAAGVLEGERLLRQIAVDIETLRAILPGLAADACIELGALARDIGQERLK